MKPAHQNAFIPLLLLAAFVALAPPARAEDYKDYTEKERQDCIDRLERHQSLNDRCENILEIDGDDVIHHDSVYDEDDLIDDGDDDSDRDSGRAERLDDRAEAAEERGNEDRAERLEDRADRAEDRKDDRDNRQENRQSRRSSRRN